MHIGKIVDITVRELATERDRFTYHDKQDYPPNKQAEKYVVAPLDETIISKVKS